MISRRTRAVFRLVTQKLFQTAGLVVRLGVCFVAGLTVLLTSPNPDYDLRFSLRGPQEIKNDFVLVELSRDDVTWMGGLGDQAASNIIWSLKEIVETSDSFFWHPIIWEKAIKRVLKSKPKAIVVTLFFGDETVRGTMNPAQQRLFQRRDIFWAAKADSDGHAILPGLARSDGSNSGVIELRPDADGKVRHFLSTSNRLSPISERVEQYISPERAMDIEPGTPINFQGPRDTFLAYSFSNLLRGRIEENTFKNKTVIFSIKDIPSHQVQTPVGSLSSGELLANLLYEFHHGEQIYKIPIWLSTLYLFFVCLVTLWLVFEYPQSVALFFTVFFSIGALSLSAALFDLKTIWIPAAGPLTCIVATYIVMSGYRLGESERFSWESERELHYLSEVESLKNNFLSLISHDLKNPLAKIQGITDRLLVTAGAVEPVVLKDDLLSIKRTSEELRQYIGSILQLTRVEARNIKLTKEVCDINSIVDDVISRVKVLSIAKNITIETHLEPIFSIEIDRTLITEVLINLVENAVKYSDPESTIDIFTSEVDDRVRVEVRDNGSGISQDDLPRLFNKFYRGTSDKTLKVTGTGLGLYLVKYFIELHGGNVFISSQLGKGTNVGFTLPLDGPEDKITENYAEFTRSDR